MRNLVRVVVLDSVVDFLLFLGKIVIVLLTGVVSYLAFAGHMPDIKDQIPSLNYIYTPVVFIVIGSYCIARCISVTEALRTSSLKNTISAHSLGFTIWLLTLSSSASWR